MSYWDRLAKIYTNLGKANFWLHYRLRLLENMEGSVLEACCGGGQLLVEMIRRGFDAYGLDRSRKMICQSQQTLTVSGYGSQRLVVGDVTHLPFSSNTFDVVIVTGAIGLFRRPVQQQAIRELARVAIREVRLLEPYEEYPGIYPARVLGWMFDGQHPIPGSVLSQSRLDYAVEWNALWGVFSYIHCRKT